MLLLRSIMKSKWKVSLSGVRYIHHFLPAEKTYINGSWVSATGKKAFPVLNPSNGETICSVPDCEKYDLELAIAAANDAFKTWSVLPAKERAQKLRKLHDLQMKNVDYLATLITLEAGKPIKESIGEIIYGASFLEWFAEEARRVYGDIIPSPFKDKQPFAIKKPVGVAAIITPWNFPNAMITRKVGAALAAGCTCVIKPAEDTPLSALALAKLAEEAEIPPGVINIVTCSKLHNTHIGRVMCIHDDVAALSFTGSTETGKTLNGMAGRYVKKVSLELGGNAPFIVFNSANVHSAVSGLMASKFRNSGQTCVCTNRILVQDEIYDLFVEELAIAMSRKLKVGDGFEEGVTIGPLINEKALDKVKSLVDDAFEKGAHKMLGGNVHPRGKTFFEPTLLLNIKPGMNLCSEEVFGPVAPVMAFSNEEDAIKIANSTKTGLAGYFYSEDVKQIWRVANRLEVGMVGINDGIISMAEVPFGGVKESGLGREGSHYGIDEYTDVKYICLGGLE